MFPKRELELYVNIASDDARGNITDLLAHWDHTLGYLIGLKKFHKFENYTYFIGIEYLSTRISNTFKSEFYRGDEPPNYYAKPRYDFFSYYGRRIGAHSGSSSDDLIIKVGLGNKKIMAFLAFNHERHGIKSMNYPENKKEILFNLDYQLNNLNNISINFENEKVSNFGYNINNISTSRVVWLSYSMRIK